MGELMSCTWELWVRGLTVCVGELEPWLERRVPCEGGLNPSVREPEGLVHCVGALLCMG